MNKNILLFEFNCVYCGANYYIGNKQLEIDPAEEFSVYCPGCYAANIIKKNDANKYDVSLTKSKGHREYV